MEEKIKRIIKELKIQYLLFWLVPLLLIISFETDFLPVGIYADSVEMQYIWGTVGVLVAILMVPLSLKLFSWVLKKKIDTASFPVALKNYLFWSGVRLGLLEFTVLFNFVVYYITLDNIGGFCGLIALTASVFCLPGEKRLKEELNIFND